MKFSFVIPAHNEKENLKKFIPSLQKIGKYYELDSEIIIIDDNSTDGTCEIAKNFSKIYSNVKVIRRNAFPGYGNALKDGFKVAQGDIVIVIECDGNHRVQDIPKLIKKINEGYDLVIGSRFLKDLPKGYPFVRLIANRVYNFLLRILFHQKFCDPTNGLKAYNKNFLDKIEIKSEGFEVNAEIFLKALKENLRITEVPVEWKKRKAGVSKFTLLKVGSRYLKVAFLIFIGKL